MELIKAFDNQEPLVEMATVAIDRSLQLRIQVNPDRNRRGAPYFKVFDAAKDIPGETRVARLHFLDSGMEYHKDSYLDWRLTNKDVRRIQKFLQQPYKNTEYTVWQMTCFLWNQEFRFSDFEDEYFNGEDEAANKSHPSYVPFDTKMPNTWIYDPPKGKNKRK